MAKSCFVSSCWGFLPLTDISVGLRLLNIDVFSYKRVDREVSCFLVEYTVLPIYRKIKGSFSLEEPRTKNYTRNPL